MAQCSVQIDDELKADVTEVLKKIDMTKTQAVNILFKRIDREGCFPLANVPNQATIDSFNESKNGGGKSFGSASEMMRSDFK